MGAGCCKAADPEFNPDGSEKDTQTQEQSKNDPADLRKWAKDGDAVELERLLKRMPAKAIGAKATKAEGVPEDEGHTALHLAATRGSLPCVELLVLYGSAVNGRGGGGATPLHCALEGGRRQVAHFLLEHGADINAKDATGASPFLAVLVSGRKRLSGWLLQRCGGSLEVGATDKAGLGPCAVAARNGWWELLDQLAAAASDPAMALNTRSSEGDTPLGWVLKYGAAGLLSGEALAGVAGALLDRGASAVVPAFKEQIPPICLAAATGNIPLLAALRNRGAVLDPAAASDAVRRNALHYAAAKGHELMCEELMREGGAALQPHVTDAAGNTPLHLAALRGHGDVARMMLEASKEGAADDKAALMTPNLEGVATYHLFLMAGPDDRSQRGVLWVLERISPEEAKTPIKNKDGLVIDTPLLLAVGSHQERVVAALLAAGHSPDEANRDGDTPLSRCLASATADTAAADGAIFRQLVEGGAGLESASGDCHPLLAVCKNPLSRFAEQVIELLLSRQGGDASALDWSQHADALGRGPLHLAALHDNAFMVRYLVETAKLEVDLPSSEGLTPLMYAAWGCSPNAMKVLLNRRADPRAADPSGRSALAYCLRLDRPESLACAAMLLVMGAAPDDAADVRGEGLLHRAVRYGSSEFIRLWMRYGGNVCLLATTEDTADDPAEALQKGGGAARGPAEDYIDAAPQPLEAEEEAEDGAWDLGSTSLAGADSLAAGAADAEAAAAGAGLSFKGAELERPGSGSFRREGDAEAGGAEGGEQLIKAYHPEQSGFSAGSGGGGGGGGGGSLRREADAMSATGGGEGGAVKTYGSFAGSGGRAPSGRTAAEAAGFGDTPSQPQLGSGGVGGSRRVIGSGSGSRRAFAAPGGGGGVGEIETVESFSLPGAGGAGRGGAGTAGSRAVAEAVEAVEAEVGRFPSFCRRPSVVEVRRWARRGAAWFDDALPTADPELGPDGCPPALPLPPGDEEDAEEEARLADEAAPELLAALDADAIWRRMLLDRMSERRAARAGGGGGSFVGGGGGGGGGTFVGGGRGALAGSGGGSGGAGSGRPGSSGSGGRGPAGAAGGREDWMEEVVRSAEAALAAISRGKPVGGEGPAAAGGSGSRAVRAMRQRSGSGDSPAAAGAGAEAEGARRRAKAARRTGPGPVAEGRSDSSSSSDDSDNADAQAATGEGKMESALEDLKDVGIGLASKLLDKKVAINDRYYQRGTRYKGVPKYMDENVVNVQPAPMDALLALADELHARLARYPPALSADEPLLRGADLRERNIKFYNLGLSPAEYPMKLGQWKGGLKKAKAAAAAARKREPRGPGGKVVVRSRKAWFGLPAMPSRPELRGTSALCLAVRLARPSCVAALLAASLQHLNLPDGWGHTPAAYAAYMLARDKHSAPLQLQYDMLLAKLPQVNYTRLDSDNGNAGHSLLCPINLAIIAGDRPRLAHLVLRCAGAINNSWTLLSDIPTYLSGAWDKVVAKCDSRCPALALAVLSKRIDTVRLCLDLGANPNTFGEGRDVRAKAKLAAEWSAEQERIRRLADDYEGLLSHAKLGLMQRLARLKRAIANIEIPGLTKPHPFVTPLHLAARTGQAEVTFLLVRRGALANGGGAVPYAKRTPLQEAVMYARSNFGVTNGGARRKNWREVRPAFEDLPPMSDAAAKKEADSRASTMMRAMVDPTVIALKAVAMAAKYAVNFLLEMRKRPIAHWDPAVWPAHVLLAFRAPYDLTDSQTGILLRDMMDNGKWKWLRRPGAHKFKVNNDAWTGTARTEIEGLKEDSEIGYSPMGRTGEPKEYKSLKQQFVSRCDEAYINAGGRALHERYSACSQLLLEEHKAYVFEQLQPAIMNLAHQAVMNHVAGAGALLERTGAERRFALEGAAAGLAAGVALDEAEALDPKPFKAFAPPVLAPAPGAAPAQAAASEALAALAGRAGADESWGRCMRWGAGGIFLGMPEDANLEPLPSGQDELSALGKELADVDTDELKESLENFGEAMGVAADWMMARLQDAQEGFSNLLEVIGIDFLDVL